MKNKVISLISAFALLLAAPKVALAEITNKAVAGTLGSNATLAGTGATFAFYLVTLWRAVVFVGALFVIIYFLWGAFEWIVAGGDAGKIGKARDKITQAVIGFVILVGSFTIIGFVGAVFFGGSFNLLQITIPSPGAVNTTAVPSVTLPGSHITVP